MNFKRVAGAVWPFAVLAVLYAGILRFSHTEKDSVLIVPLGVGSAFYLIIYITSAFRMSVRKAVVISSVLALLVSVGAGWWLFWGFWAALT